MREDRRKTKERKEYSVCRGKGVVDPITDGVKGMNQIFVYLNRTLEKMLREIGLCVLRWLEGREEIVVAH